MNTHNGFDVSQANRDRKLHLKVSLFNYGINFLNKQLSLYSSSYEKILVLSNRAPTPYHLSLII